MRIVGIDEVGRGPLAGPLVVCGVMLNGAHIPGMRDSKKLSKKKIAELNDAIIGSKATFVMAARGNLDIDNLGMAACLKLCIQEIEDGFPGEDVWFQLDGSVNYLSRPGETIIKGDDRIEEIKAASILAKFFRDSLMKKRATEYPGYGFEQNSGYGSSSHIAAIRKLGPCKIHRLSFLKKIMA